MITEYQLQSIGYYEKSKLINNSRDFRHNDFENRPYLVNINEGLVRVDHHMKSENRSFQTDDFQTFKNWHDNFCV